MIKNNAHCSSTHVRRLRHRSHVFKHGHAINKFPASSSSRTHAVNLTTKYSGGKLSSTTLSGAPSRANSTGSGVTSPSVAGRISSRQLLPSSPPTIEPSSAVNLTVIDGSGSPGLTPADKTAARVGGSMTAFLSLAFLGGSGAGGGIVKSTMRRDVTTFG